MTTHHFQPLSRRLPWCTGIVLAGLASAGMLWGGSPEAPPVVADLTLDQAVQTALQNHPKTRVAECDVQAAQARLQQSGVRPNPELEAGVEEFGGNGSRRALDAASGSIGLSQLFELGSKRDRRRDLAAAEVAAMQTGVWQARQELTTDVSAAFFTALAAQARLELAEKLAQLSRETALVAAARAKAGEVPQAEAIRADIAVAKADGDVAGQQQALTAARSALALLLGTELPAGRCTGDLSALPAVPPREQLLLAVAQSAPAAAWRDERAARVAAVRLEEAKRVPDVTVRAGVLRFEDGKEQAFAVGVSVPLPLFDRNRGGIAEARHLLARSEAAALAAELDLKVEVTQVHAELATAREGARRLQGVILPATEALLNTTQTGYAKGKFTHLELLEARRTWYEARQELLSACNDYHQAAVKLLRLATAKNRTTEAQE